MTTGQEIRIPVTLDAKTFRHFAFFDQLRRKKQWVKPLGFTLILLIFAIAALLTGKPQAGMIAAVLLAVGFGLPLVYLGLFLAQINQLAERQKLGGGKKVYTVTLRKDDFHVEGSVKAGEEVTVAWKDADRAYRNRKCIYLYAAPERAFLLPAGQATAADDEVWSTIVRNLGENKCRTVW